MPRPAAPTFSPGFRLSRLDVAILVGGGLATFAVGRLDHWAGIAVAFVVGHFFLFCNVLGLSRPPELIWAGVFAALAVGAVLAQGVSWPVALGVSVVLTAILAVRESRRPWYHGVGWRRLNPQLPAWWSAHRADGRISIDPP